MVQRKNPSVFFMGNELPEKFSRYLIGRAYLQPLTDKGGPIANVTFEPGCRNSWHIHHKGVSAEGGSNEWLEPVSDEVYGKLYAGAKRVGFQEERESHE